MKNGLIDPSLEIGQSFEFTKNNLAASELRNQIFFCKKKNNFSHKLKTRLIQANFIFCLLNYKKNKMEKQFTMYLRTFARVVEANFPPGKKLSTCARVDDFLETNFSDSLISRGQTRKKTLHYCGCQNSSFHDFSSHMNFILISSRVNHFLFRILRTLDVRSGARLNQFTFCFSTFSACLH